MLLSDMTIQLRDSLTTTFYPPTNEVLEFLNEIRTYLPSNDRYDPRLYPLLREVLDAFLSQRINAVALTRALQTYIDWQNAIDFAPKAPIFESLQEDIYQIMPEDWNEPI